MHKGRGGRRSGEEGHVAKFSSSADFERPKWWWGEAVFLDIVPSHFLYKYVQNLKG